MTEQDIFAQLGRQIGDAHAFAIEQTAMQRETGQIWITLLACAEGVQINMARQVYIAPPGQHRKVLNKIVGWRTIADARINPIVMIIKDMLDEIQGRKPARF